MILLDFETASDCDLEAAGAWRYSEDPTTEVLCLVARDVESGRTIQWRQGWPLPPVLAAWAADLSQVWVAHNAAFEKAIWRNVLAPMAGLPDIPDNRWDDTMAHCAYHAIPLALETALAVLHIPTQKDMEGRKLVLELSNPKSKHYGDRSDETLDRVLSYCATDVDAEAGLLPALGGLSVSERRVWLLDQRINQRGVRLDIPFVRAASRVVEEAKAPLEQRFHQLSGLKPTQVQKIGQWCKDRGVTLPNLRAETVDEILEDCTIALPPEVEEALYIRSLIGSAAVKKLPRMEECVCADGRARGLLQYHGATPGRWAARLIQPQNMPRGTIKLDRVPPDPQLVVDTIMTGDWGYVQDTLGPAIEVVVHSLRHGLISGRGRIFGVGDFAGVEARLVLALAGQHDKTALMASGADVYCDMAGVIYGRTITKEFDPEGRTIGKNTVLGCGFQMGADTFQRRYARNHDGEFCKRVIHAYRKEWAPLVPELWYGLEKAAARTAHYRKPHEFAGIVFAIEEIGAHEWMTARLLSGRKLWYYSPCATLTRPPWAEDDSEEVRMTWDFKAQKTGHWITRQAYGGLLTENVIQALARDLLVTAMFKCEKEGLPVVLTVHDEIILETEESRLGPKGLVLKQIMEDSPPWAKMIQAPISAETWVGERYRKA